MDNANTLVTIFGGSGFLGTQLVQALARRGYRMRVAVRRPDLAGHVKPLGAVGQVQPIQANIRNPESVARAVRGASIVINLVGVLYEKKKNTFERLHADLPQTIAQACAQNNVARFIHVSALGVDRGQSKYARSKKHGEESVMRFFPAATILRPSIVFGAGDHFFNRFAVMAKFFPVLPLIGGGKTKFQPVFVGDVADAVIAAAARPDTQGRTYELGGPEVLTFKALFQRMFAVTRQPRALMPLPFGLAKIQGAVLSVLPVPPLTADQVESLKTDNVVQAGALTLHDLGIAPASLDVVLPTYLQQYRPGGRFADKKTA